MDKERAPRNKTITLDENEREQYAKGIIRLDKPSSLDACVNKTINQNMLEAVKHLPARCVDLLFLDPPYNLKKDFHGSKFAAMSVNEYSSYLESWLPVLIPLLKETASVYICGDYNSSTSILLIASKYLVPLNRITWQREKGRGAKVNWKNSSEDIWFFARSAKYHFYVDRVKEKRRVVAPYKVDGKPKDWEETTDGNFRLTHPSNIWTDLTVPYWSMPENTDHPTQKPEKLLAKIILASSNEGDIVLDPFLGSGTTSVTAKKLGRKYIGIEQNFEYCLLAEKRLCLAETDKTIQGYTNGVFWERNSLNIQNKNRTKNTAPAEPVDSLFKKINHM